MRVGLSVFTAAGLAAMAALATGGGAKDAAIRHLSYIFNGELGPSLEAQLGQSGLAPSDVEHVVERVMQGYAECFVDTLTTDDSELGQKFVALLADGRSMKEVGVALRADDVAWAANMERLEDVLARCAMEVDQEAGLPPG